MHLSSEDLQAPMALQFQRGFVRFPLEESNEIIETFKKEFCANRHHLYINHHFLTAQKPA
jgi:hypothetical protein